LTTTLRVDVSPRELLDLLPHPREVREGQAPHGRHSGPLRGQDVHGFPYAVRKMLDLGMVIEFKTEIDVAREMLDVLKGRFRVSRVVFNSSAVREARDGQRGV